MISFKKAFHVHTFKPTPHTFALLPKMNIKTEHQKGIEGKIEECDCGSKRWLHPSLRTVEVEEIDS